MKKIILPAAIETYNTNHKNSVRAEYNTDSVVLYFTETATSPRVMCVFKNDKHAADYLFKKSAKYTMMKIY